jgi:hypothetical protein
VQLSKLDEVIEQRIEYQSSCVLRVLRCNEASKQFGVKGHELPRQSLVSAAAVLRITDAKADGRCGRNGPNADI